MAELVRKWSLYAAPDGLLLRAAGKREQKIADVHVEYATTNISTRSDFRDAESSSHRLEIHGIVGILDLVASPYLIVITQTEEVAQIRGKAVYAVRDVVLIPLTSQSDAESVIGKTLAALKQPANSTADADAEVTDVEEDTEPASVEGDAQPPEAAAVEPPSNIDESAETSKVESDEQLSEPATVDAPKGVLGQTSSLAKNVVQQPGRYGRFAKSWFSKSNAAVGASNKQGDSKNDDLALYLSEQDGSEVPKNEKTLFEGSQNSAEEKDSNEKGSGETPSSNATTAGAKQTNAIEALSGRIQRTTKLYFSSSGFYFSYDYDISTRLGGKKTAEPDLPLWKKFDPLYFWNYNLINRFIHAGRYELVLPLMQGFVGQREVSIATSESDQNDSIEDAGEPTANAAPETSAEATAEDSTKPSEVKNFLLTLISRRSIRRAGLRYLRRGIDDDGNVANAVETEQILSSTTWSPSDNVYSLVQTRGSIPLHFTQSPYSFKPTAVIHGSESTNQAAMKKHFTSMLSRYGEVQAVSLVDKHPPENNIGQLYEDHVEKVNGNNGIGGKSIAFEWFDFHGACKGMKFENVSILITTLESKLKAFGWTVERDRRLTQQQAGVLRTNCMDCLDRSNVVQSAIASWILERQLGESGIQINLKTDPKTQWFNSLWADNGDAISKQYAGTAALKGDFTRTRKRNWTGALTDFSLTMNRYYNNIFGDYFLQTCIDYFLGNAGPAVFDEFETDMMAKDYDALDMGRIRQSAIDTCVKAVLEDPEDGLLESWTLSCPNQANTLRSLPFEECVLLMTKGALSFCRFDWETEKIASFEKVLLTDILEIWRGAYVTNAFGTNLDETKNVGFALRYRPAENFMVRRNTRTLETDDKVSEENATKSKTKKKNQPENNQPRLLAFKALPPDISHAKKSGNTENMNEVEFVKHICDKIHAAMKTAAAHDHLGLDQISEVEERDVISAADAKKNTGYVESLGYSLKRLVWS